MYSLILIDLLPNNNWVFVFGIIIALVIYNLWSKNKKLQKEKENFAELASEKAKQLEIENIENQNKIKELLNLSQQKENEQLLIYQKKEAELKNAYHNWALEEFEKFIKSKKMLKVLL